MRGNTRITLAVLLLAGAASAGQPPGPTLISAPSPACVADDLFGAGEAGKNISAVAVSKGGLGLVVGGDEGRAIQVLKRRGDGCYVPGLEIALPAGGEPGDEADVEGITRDGDTYYAIGSHSVARKKMEKEKTAAKNRERLVEPKAQESRRGLYRIKGGPDGLPTATSSIEKASLHGFIASERVLKLFTPVPSKENGIDIEGLAADGQGRLFGGLRGPVLRENWVPVIVLSLKAGPTLSDFEAEVRYVNLSGLGIRDLTRVDGGFLILAGPVGDAPPLAKLVFWNGKDGVPDSGKVERVTLLGDIPAPENGKAEGITLLQEDGPDRDSWDLLVVYDGVPNGAPARFQVKKPRPN